MLTILTPATDRSLLTTAELRAAVGISDGSRDAELITLGARVSAAITRVCNVATAGVTPATLRQEAVSETFRLEHEQDGLVLARRPIASVTSITENGVALATTDFEIDAASAIVERLCDDRRRPWPCGKIVAVTVAGWDTVPDDLKLASARLAKLLWSDVDRDPLAKSITTPDVETIEYWVGPVGNGGMPADILVLLRPYMNISVG